MNRISSIIPAKAGTPCENIIICIIFSFFFLLTASKVYSQTDLGIKVSASNLFRYGNGEQNSVLGSTDKTYLEELGEARIFIKNFTLGVRYEFDDPIEFGTGTKGISRRYLEFKKDEFDVTAGNSYELFGKGLTLNSFENRGLGYNLQIDGLNMKYKKSFKNVKLDGTIVAGDITYHDYLDTSRVEKYGIRAVNFNVSPFKQITVGGSYLYSNGDLPLANIRSTIHTEIFEGDFSLNIKSLDFYAAYANKVTITDPNTIITQSQAPRGDGAYGYATYTRKGFGITVDYKNYRFNLVRPDERSATSLTKPLPFQVPPSCIKEPSYTLLSRYPHQVDFGDEVGLQTEIFYTPKDNLTLNFNASLTSRHYDYVNISQTGLPVFKRIERSSAFLPSTNAALSPYWEVFLEAEYYYTKNLKIKVAAARQYSNIYNIYDPSTSDITKTTTLPVEVTYNFSKIYSVNVDAEQQQVYNSVRIGDKNYYNEYISIGISRSPSITLTGNFEISNDNEDPSGKKHWFSGEISYKFTSANTAILSYGSERGGLKCSGGICRYVLPFSGFRLTIINNLN